MNLLLVKIFSKLKLMNNLIYFLENYISKNKKNIIETTSSLVKIKSYSSKEKNVSDFIYNFIKKHPDSKNINIRRIKNNVILEIKNTFSTKKSILYDAHLDTVPVSNITEWIFDPFSGKIHDGKIYGRGSCDDKGCVVALIFTALALSKFLSDSKLQLSTRVLFSLSTNEEDSSGKGFEEVLKHISADFVVICEPSDLQIIQGHKGKYSFKVTFYGKPVHSSIPERGINAIYLANKLISKVETTNNTSKIVSPLGKNVCSVTFVESKTNSFNSIPYECSVYIDYRGVNKESEKTIISKFVNRKLSKLVKVEPLHRLFYPWVLDKKNPITQASIKTYNQIFHKKTEPSLWPFCTNGSISMGKFNIPTTGFGPGKPVVAHQNNEYIEISQLLDAIKFYSVLPFNI